MAPSSATAVRALTVRSRGRRFEDAFGLVLLLVLSTLVVASLVPYRGWGGVCITALCSLSVVTAFISARARPRVIVWGGRIAAVAVLVAVAGAAADERAFFGIAAVVEALLLARASLSVLGAVITEQRVGFRTILGAVSVYITLGLLYAFAYVALDRLQDQPFFGPDAQLQAGDFLFFSMTTLTTTGYGNLVPAGQPGKLFAIFEMLMGQILLVTLIARLVSMWRPGEWVRHEAGLVAQRREEEAP
jgi:Ion channel